jgi:hypothetical protein
LSRRRPRRVFLAGLALLLAAAGPAPESGGAEVRTADYVFSYRWPAAVEAVPDLRSRLMKDQEAVRRAFAEEALPGDVVGVHDRGSLRIGDTLATPDAPKDADGKLLGKYRKMHIPDDPGFYEKFYFVHYIEFNCFEFNCTKR